MTARSPLMLSAGILLLSMAVVPAQQPARSAPPPLPEGAGKARVESTCSKSHGLNFIANSGGNTRAEWDELIQSMVALPGADRTATVDYLAKHFPPTKRTEAKLLPGPAKVTIREWMVPTLGSRPRDPLAGADGSIWAEDRAGNAWFTAISKIVWYSESAVTPNTLVRFDPKTETFQSWAIPSGGGVVRNMMGTSNGNLALACSGVNRVALVEIN